MEEERDSSLFLSPAQLSPRLLPATCWSQLCTMATILKKQPGITAAWSIMFPFWSEINERFTQGYIHVYVCVYTHVYLSIKIWSRLYVCICILKEITEMHLFFKPIYPILQPILQTNIYYFCTQFALMHDHYF